MRLPDPPSFLVELVAEPKARDALLAGSVALFAAGMDPKVWSAGLPSVQAAIRARPEIEALALVMAVLGAGVLFLGGAIGDSSRARPIVIGGLVVLLGAALFGLIVPDGPLFITSRVIGSAASAFIIPVSLASVAISYTGAARATAIGIAYGALGAASALTPILLQLLPTTRAPAFIGAVVACALAILIVRRRLPVLQRPTTAERPYVIATALWGFGVVSVTCGVVWFGGGLDNPVRWLLVLVGALAFAAAGIYDRRQHHPKGGIHVERRPVVIAVFVGIILAISQTIPMLQLPLYFGVVLRYGPFLSVVALAPLFAALILAGPVAGFLLARYRPRTLVGAGVVAVGFGDLALALVLAPDAGYPGFVVPCILVGAGFVIATTVRTAIIFASVPRGLPATAAALNEASISVGSRIGTVLVTVLVAEAAVAAYAGSLGLSPGPDAGAAIGAFRDLLTAVGTASFAGLASGIVSTDVGLYLDAYTVGVRLALVAGAVIALVGGLIAWLSLGRQDPLTTVYAHRDERSRVGSVLTPGES